MGCDIHLCVERRIGGKWQAVHGPNPYHGKYKDEPQQTLFWLYSDRNYDVFSVLADVRNHAEIPIAPISQPRDLPADLSEDVRVERMRYGGDGHSDSWLTLEDILRYDWTKKLEVREWLSVIPQLLVLGKPWDIRIVFWFDN